MSDDSLTVTRHIRLKTPAKEAEKAIVGLQGIAEAAVVGETRLDVTYNLRQVRLDDIEQHLAQNGAVLSNSLWHSFRKSWLRFTEDNLVEQARFVHQCCNTPPSGKHS
ncbi:MAG TPA: hypothetical protein VM661_02820 [Candidatus Sulfotelmatobacter sp.]|nr:hypothetical protein [Candidatus Sulfotelmatobacter sp.]